MIRVLFVDEPGALAVRRGQLRDLRDRWAMTFLADARDARGELSHRAVDVVVSGLAVGGATGASLLEDARELCPDAIRIILSGASDDGAPIRELAIAHQSVSASGDPRRLIDAIERSLLVRSRLADPELRSLVGGLSDLPSPPTTVLRLQEALLDHPPSPIRVASVIADDVAISTKVLQLVNSAFFGMPRPLVDPVEAVTYLGSRAIAELVMTDQMLSSFRGRSASLDAEIDRIHERSVARADVALDLATRSGRPLPVARDIWTGAFLADVGQLILSAAPARVRERVLSAMDDAVDGLASSPATELTVTPATLGAQLISSWGLPHRLVECVALGASPPFVHGSEGATFTWLARLVSEGRWAPSMCTARELSTVGLTLGDLAAVSEGRVAIAVG